MKSFKSFLNEGKYPLWTKVVTAGLVLKVQRLTMDIEKETDVARQMRLIAHQNKQLAYLAGLGISVGTEDPKFVQKMRP